MKMKRTLWLVSVLAAMLLLTHCDREETITPDPIDNQR